MKTAWWAIALVVVCAFLVSSAQVFYKFASARLPEILTNWQLFVGISLYCLGAVMLIIAFKYGEISVLNPVFATSYIWVVLFSRFFFGEVIIPLKIFGVITIIIGIVLVSRGSTHGLATHESATEYVRKL